MTASADAAAAPDSGLDGTVDDGLREPVGPRAVLERVPTVCYTEVGDAAVVVHADDRLVYHLDPTAVALWAGLDGRPLAEVLADAGIAPSDDRWWSMVEILRRLKANGLVRDRRPVEEGDEIPPVTEIPSGVGRPVPVTVTASARLVPCDDDDGDDDAVELTLRVPGAADAPAEVVVELAAEHSGDGEGATRSLTAEGTPVRRVWFDPGAHGVELLGRDPADDPLVALSCWVKAVADLAALGDPDVIDTLAAIAEIPGLVQVAESD